MKKEAKKRQVEQELVTIAEEEKKADDDLVEVEQEISDVANEEAEAIERCQNELGGTRNRKAKATCSIMAPVQKKKVAAQNKRKDIQEQKKLQYPGLPSDSPYVTQSLTGLRSEAESSFTSRNTEHVQS